MYEERGLVYKKGKKMKETIFFVVMIFFALAAIAEDHFPADYVVVQQFASDDLLDRMIRDAVAQTLSDAVVHPHVSGGRYATTIQNLPKRRHTGFRAFVEDCAQTKVIPIKLLHSSDDRRAVFGVNFDGIIGFHVFTK